MTPQQAATVPVYHWDVPEDQVTKFESSHLTPEERSLVLVTKNGRRYVRMYALDAPGSIFEWLVKRYGPPKQALWGTKVQSHNTYFVWNPEKPDGDPYFMKFQLVRQDKDGDWYANNNHVNARQAIISSDVAESLLLKDPDPFVNLLPERFGATIPEGNDIPLHTYSIRSVTPVGGPPSPSARLVPLHGLLDFRGKQVMGAAEKAGLEPGESIARSPFPATGRRWPRRSRTSTTRWPGRAFPGSNPG